MCSSYAKLVLAHKSKEPISCMVGLSPERMGILFTLVWEWFKWSAIRVALFLALLAVGPSIGLILLDLVLYFYRNTVERILLIGSGETTKDDVKEEKQKVVFLKEEFESEIQPNADVK